MSDLKEFKQISLLFCLIIGFVGGSQNCHIKAHDSTGFLCLCNSSYCDTFPEIPKDKNGIYHLYTGLDSPGFNLKPVASLPNVNNAWILNVNLSEVRSSDIKGFGGSLTDAFGYNLRNLSQATQKQLLKSYFGSDGIKYNLCRVTLGCSDFSTHFYAHDSVENDTELKYFRLQDEDYKYRISIINEIKSIPGVRDLKLIASNWSPPPWMKKNHDWTRGYLKEEYHQLYADYLIRFLEEYRLEGIEFWALTPVNEPVLGLLIHFQLVNLIMTPEFQRQWLAQNLGPSLARRGFGKLEIIALDDERDFMNWWMDTLKLNPVAYNYTSGIGLHWYNDRASSPQMLDVFHQSHPDKYILYTESSVNIRFDVAFGIGLWSEGVFYGNSIIETLNHYSSGWIDWNLALDAKGGPTYHGYSCDAPIIVRPERDEFYKQPMFYVMGHFSALIEPGARTLGVNIVQFNSTQRYKRSPPVVQEVPGSFHELSGDIDFTAISNPNGQILVYVLNRFSEDKNVSIILKDGQSHIKTLNMTLSGSSINTIILNSLKRAEDLYRDSSRGNSLAGSILINIISIVSLVILLSTIK